MDKKIETRVKKAMAEKVFPGCVIGVVRKSGKREIFPFGAFMYENAGEKVIENTIYDVASVTKSIPTAALAALLIEKGEFALTDKVKQHLPEIQNDYDARVEDLLTYRVHGTQLSLLKDKTPEEFIAHVFSNGFDGTPGNSKYTNLPALLLGLIIERVTGEQIDALAQEYLFGPMTMKRTTFSPAQFPRAEIAPTEIENSGEVRGIVHDEGARVFAGVGKVVGHAGLFSTAPDLLNFLETFLAGDFPYVVRNAEKGLGWQLSDPNFMGKYCGPRTFGKTGFTGTSVVCDKQREIAFVILSNRTYPKRTPNTDTINAFRRDISDIILKNV